MFVTYYFILLTLFTHQLTLHREQIRSYSHLYARQWQGRCSAYWHGVPRGVFHCGEKIIGDFSSRESASISIIFATLSVSKTQVPLRLASGSLLSRSSSRSLPFFSSTKRQPLASFSVSRWRVRAALPWCSLGQRVGRQRVH